MNTITEIIVVMMSTVSITTNERRGFRIAEAAHYMGVSPWFVELKIRSGELRALRLCRHYTILKEDMDEFLDKQKDKIVLQRQCSSERHASSIEDFIQNAKSNAA